LGITVLDETLRDWATTTVTEKWLISLAAG